MACTRTMLKPSDVRGPQEAPQLDLVNGFFPNEAIRPRPLDHGGRRRKRPYVKPPIFDPFH